MLSDSDLSKLGRLVKENPRHKQWKPMHLFLEMQVESASLMKFGGAAALDDAREDLVKRRREKRLKRSEDIASQSAMADRKRRRFESVRAKVMANHLPTNRNPQSSSSNNVPEHVHVFKQRTRTDSKDGDTGEGNVKVCECGLEMEVEEI